MLASTRQASYLTREVYYCSRLSARPCAVLGPLAVQGYHTCARSFSLLLLPSRSSVCRPARRVRKPLKLLTPLRTLLKPLPTLLLLLRTLLATPWLLRPKLLPVPRLLPRTPLLLLRLLLRKPLLLLRKPRSTNLRFTATSFEGARGNPRALSFARRRRGDRRPTVALREKDSAACPHRGLAELG